MIPESTLEEIRSVAVCADVIGDFIKLKKQGHNMSCCCPFHDEKSPSFMVDLNENFYKCFGCGKSGSAIEFLQEYKKMTFLDAVKHLGNKYNIEIPEPGAAKVYSKPTPTNVTALSDNMVAWFRDKRKISQKTLIQLGTTQSPYWMYAKDKHKEGIVNCINFNYYRNGELINVKYRDHVKRFQMHKGAELIFYNLDSLKGATEAFIVEGEIDVHALVEAGIMKPGTAVLSVPNGAHAQKNNLSYVDNCIHLFKEVKLIIIAVDDDIPGRKLREDLAQRFGKERSRYIEWKNCKDANEVLIKHGPEDVQKCCSLHIKFPIEGVFNIDDYSDAIDDIFINGIDPGASVKTLGDKFDEHLRFVTGWVTVVTGIPQHGKSDVLDQILLGLMLNHNWKGAIYSPENDPFPLHFSKLARKLIGKPFPGLDRKPRSKEEYINEQEKNLAKRFLLDKLWIIKPPKQFTLETILESAIRTKEQYGIKWFCIDAWNRLEHKGRGANIEQYVQEKLIYLDTNCRFHDLHCFLVAHPTKLEKEKKIYPVPTMYNISGGAHFFNIPANGISVYRDFINGVTDVHIQKVKFIPYWGTHGKVSLKYDLESGRFNETAGEQVIYDKSNWITKENRQIKADLPLENTTTVGMSLLKPGDELPF